MEGPYETAFIKTEQINKNYVLEEIAVRALRDISLELYRGKPIVTLGPSRSGKSALLNILGGIEVATSERLLYRGKELDWKDKKALTAYRRAYVGFMFRLYNLMPGLTTLENVELTAELGKHPLDAGELTEQVGSADRADHFLSKLSEGQQQRVAIARTLCKDLDILLYDEPTRALSSRTGVQILKLLADLNRAYQKAVVLITHNQKIIQITHRVLYFKDGCLKRIGQNKNPSRPEEAN